MQIAAHFTDLESNTRQELQSQVREFQTEGRKVWLTSSFQTQSLPLLHMLSQVAPEVPVILIDTGFLFPETYAFARQLEGEWGLDLVQIRSQRTYHDQRTPSGHFLFTEDIDRCCQVNKVEPIQDLIRGGDVWISGVRRDQSAVRAAKKRIETDARDVLRYHPMLNWTGRDVYFYINNHKLPKHPLESQGFVSIGCVPCTRKWADPDRGGRWEGSSKTECGLHTK